MQLGDYKMTTLLELELTRQRVKLEDELAEVYEAYEGLKAKNACLLAQNDLYLGEWTKQAVEYQELEKKNADLIEQIDIDFNYQKHLVAQLSK